MNTNVEALQGLYVKMGGNPEDVSDKTTISEMIDAITAIGIVDRVARSGNYITATTAAEMNDESAIYVYTGSESGYNQGHLYYWDGTEYVDGGEYNGAKAEIDPTLSHTGKAADAKKTGDAIASLNGSLENLGEHITDLLTTADTSDVSITVGKEIRNSDGAVITNAKTAIITKYGTRYRAIEMTGDTYQQKVVLYNQSNQYDGLLSDYTNDIVNIPKSALYFRCTFKRKDGADMTSADIQTIRDAMVWYKQTDDSLSVPNIPADSSATGIRLTNVENRVSALEDATIPVDVKQALLRLLKKATYTSADMSADIRTVQDWVGIQVHYIDVSIKGNAPGTSDGSKKITSTLAYDNGLSAVFEVGASIYKVTDTGTHDRFRFYGISADLDVNDPSDFAQITVDRIADATTVSGLDSMSEYTVDNTVTQYKIIFVYLRDDTTDYNPNLVVEEVAE